MGPDLSLFETQLADAGWDGARLRGIAEAAAAALGLPTPEARLRALAEGLPVPQLPHEGLRTLLELAWTGEDEGVHPVWFPTKDGLANLNVGGAFPGLDWAGIHALSVERPQLFWPVVLKALGIKPANPASTVLDLSEGAEAARWFPGMRLNIAASCFEGRSLERPAILRQPEGGALEAITLGALLDSVRRVASGLLAIGLGPGDAIAIDMPMTAEAVAIYLGIVWMGGAVVSIADSFTAPEIATRLRIAGARAIFTTDRILRGGRSLPLFERVVEAAAPRAIVLAASGELSVELREGDLSWTELLAAGEGKDPAARIVDAEATTNILYSSGTTGDPKAIAWTHLTPIKAAADGWAHQDLRKGDVVAWPTNLGWMMGPWLIYATLLNGATIGLYEGLPGGAGFAAFVEEAGVSILGVVPSLVKSWRQSGAVEGRDWSRIRAFSSTGEASNADDMLWLMARAGLRPVIEYCGGTEIGGGYITGTLMLPSAPGTFSTAAVGSDFVILDEGGGEAPFGELALLPPMLGSSNHLLNRDHHEVYFAGMPPGPIGQVLRRHGDQMERLPGGYLRAHGRADDTMNLGGIKVSSAEIERACLGVLAISETAAVAIPPPGGGPDRLYLFVVLSPGADPEVQGVLKQGLQAAIRARLNPLFKIEEVKIVESLPRTASNKVMRRVLRHQIEAGEAV